MELRHIRYFLAVAEELNFRRAAERIGIAQPPLSSQIRDLETELGVLLFRRVPRGAELTDAGTAFLAEARTILAQVEQARKMAVRGAKGEIGRLRVGFTGSAAFCPVVANAVRAFRRAFPQVELTLAELDTVQLLDSLKRQALDAVFIRPGRDDPDGVRTIGLFEEPMLVALPLAHPRAGDPAVELIALKDDPLVLFARASGPSLFDGIIEACRRAGFEPALGQVAPQITSIANLVAVELGVSIVPAAVATINVPGIVYLPIRGEAPVARLALSTRLDERSAVVRNFVTVLATLDPAAAAHAR